MCAFKKPILIICIIFLSFFFLPFSSTCFALENTQNFAETEMIESLDKEKEKNYSIYTTDGSFLFEKEGVKIGDEYLSKEFKKYVVEAIDENNQTGIARFIGVIKKPNIDFSTKPNFVSNEENSLALYCTHNDESYVTGDGTESVYGAGGIHDIANALKNNFINMGIKTTFNETLHIPHDNSAYSRSSKTAKTLLENEPDAIFDIHRDGTSRSYYITRDGGKERCMVRIVVGKANGNMKENEEFALYLMSVANELYPWLIKDIYYATGHYNQGLSNKSLLFEMGSHLVEKSLVLESVAPLADVINTALFKTTVNEESGDLTINGIETEEEKLITNVFNEKQEKKQDNSTAINIIGIIFGLAGIVVVIIYFNKKLKS